MLQGFGKIMTDKKTVLIHSIRDSMTNLADSMEHFKPDYIYLLTPKFYANGKAALAKMEIEERNKQTFGPNVNHVKYVDLRIIEDAWSQSTMLEMHQKIDEIKKDAQQRAGKSRCEFYAGLSDGPGLMSPSIAFSAVLHNMKTYFTRGRRPYYDKQYVLEIDNLNKITNVKNWLDSKIMNQRNLRYLKHIIDFEDDGVSEINTKNLEGVMTETVKAINNALKKLEEYELITIEGKRNRRISSTELGRLTINLGLGSGV